MTKLQGYKWRYCPRCRGDNMLFKPCDKYWFCEDCGNALPKKDIHRNKNMNIGSHGFPIRKRK